MYVCVCLPTVHVASIDSRIPVESLDISSIVGNHPDKAKRIAYNLPSVADNLLVSCIDDATTRATAYSSLIIATLDFDAFAFTAIFQGSTRDIFITYTRYDKLQGAATTHTGPAFRNDAGANFRESSTRDCKLFNRSVCGGEMCVGAKGACVRVTARV